MKPLAKLPLRCLLAGLILSLAPTLHADEMDEANRAYADGRFDEAATLFKNLISEQGYSAPLCFDLANAQWKAGQVGPALLNYERARYLAPGDGAIDQNLQLARQQAGLGNDTFRWWEVLLRECGDAFGVTATGLLILLILGMLARPWSPQIAAGLGLPEARVRRGFKALFFIALPLCLFCAFVELSALGFNRRISGVVVAPKAAVLRLSPFDSAEAVGTIPEGELVTIEERHDGYLRIDARDNHFGWLKESEVEPLIPAQLEQ
jgi:tetratricopeptide (TPR) repeat protein